MLDSCGLEGLVFPFKVAQLLQRYDWSILIHGHEVINQSKLFISTYYLNLTINLDYYIFIHILKICSLLIGGGFEIAEIDNFLEVILVWKEF